MRSRLKRQTIGRVLFPRIWNPSQITSTLLTTVLHDFPRQDYSSPSLPFPPPFFFFFFMLVVVAGDSS